VGSLQYILERGQEDDWYNSPLITVLTIITVIGSVAFIWRELTTDHPIVNLRILKNRSLSLGMITTFILGFGLFGSVFIFPIFCQSLLGFSAQQTGMLMIPGGLATIAMMPFVGRMLQRGIPPQIMASAGMLFFFLFTYTLSKSNLLSGENNFYLPLIIRGIGLSLLFVPLTTLALGSLKPADVPQGTGLNNMMRQLGGSFGIALITTILHNRQGLHRSQLVEHLNQYNPAFNTQLSNATNNFIAKGYSFLDAQTLALKSMDFSVLKQTLLLSYIDGFWFVGIFFLLSIPLLFLQKFKKGSAIGAGAH
jgi:DHA2 family multidrug resistance protein